MKQQKTSLPKIVAFCNPLLDITVNLDAFPKYHDLLERYSLEGNNAILAEEHHLPLYREIEENSIFSAGGSAQNSLRAAKNVLNRFDSFKDVECMFVGSTSKDQWMDMMKIEANKDAIRTEYHLCTSHPTGTCAVLINDGGQKRSLVANLGAANHYDFSHAKALKQEIEAAKIIYISGFFLTVSTETIHYVFSISSPNSIKMMNISAPFLCEPFIIAELVRAIQGIDILFGNENELKSLAKGLLSCGDDEEINDDKIMELRSKLPINLLLIITQGSDDTILSWNDRIERIPVEPKIEKEEIIDTNGAGDCFVGGFMARLLMEIDDNSTTNLSKKDILSTKEGLLPLIREGHKMGGEIIRRNGVYFE